MKMVAQYRQNANAYREMAESEPRQTWEKLANLLERDLAEGK